MNSPKKSPNFEDAPSKNKNSRRGKRRGVWFDQARQKWCANGQRPNGSRWRRYDFDDRASAEEWRRKTLAAASQAADALERQSVLMPTAVLRDIAAAAQLARESGRDPWQPGFWVALVEMAVDRDPAGKNISVADAVEEWFAATKSSLKPKSQKDARDCIKRFVDHVGGDTPLHRVERDSINKLLAPYRGLRRKNILAKTKDLFFWAQENGYVGDRLSDLPTFGIRPPRIARSEPTPISVGDAEKLVALAVQTERHLWCTAWIVLRLFLGLRDAEAARVRYHLTDGVCLPRGFVYLSRAVAKHRERLLPWNAAECHDSDIRPVIPPNIAALLADLPQQADGTPLAPSRWNQDRFAWLARANGIGWGHNGLRAAFATFHCAKFKRHELTAQLMGHTIADGGLETLRNHYQRWATYEQGNAFFSIGLHGREALASMHTFPIGIWDIPSLAKRRAARTDEKQKTAAA